MDANAMNIPGKFEVRILTRSCDHSY